MGVIKDIVDLTKDLESRVKDRRDMEIIHKIQGLAFSLQSQHADILERNVDLIRENAHLKTELEKVQAEEIRIHSSIEFRRGKRTSGQWMPFCPNCHMPARINDAYGIMCSAACGWVSDLPPGDLVPSDFSTMSTRMPM